MAIKKTPAGANLEQADLFSGVDEIEEIKSSETLPVAKVILSTDGPKDPHDPKLV